MLRHERQRLLLLFRREGLRLLGAPRPLRTRCLLLLLGHASSLVVVLLLFRRQRRRRLFFFFGTRRHSRRRRLFFFFFGTLGRRKSRGRRLPRRRVLFRRRRPRPGDLLRGLHLLLRRGLPFFPEREWGLFFFFFFQVHVVVALHVFVVVVVEESGPVGGGGEVGLEEVVELGLEVFVSDGGAESEGLVLLRGGVPERCQGSLQAVDEDLLVVEDDLALVGLDVDVDVFSGDDKVDDGRRLGGGTLEFAPGVVDGAGEFRHGLHRPAVDEEQVTGLASAAAVGGRRRGGRGGGRLRCCF
mmetsp:Transcript_15372/g.50280  ORF Transcript_15372/g.50280 Transcript_15372/m.50280 type:complete len:299 (-) Transcript_15372:793-1689(-)